eukprot:Colp12_sorted_trinity150504_noHs@16227
MSAMESQMRAVVFENDRVALSHPGFVCELPDHLDLPQIASVCHEEILGVRSRSARLFFLNGVEVSSISELYDGVSLVVSSGEDFLATPPSLQKEKHSAFIYSEHAISNSTWPDFSGTGPSLIFDEQVFHSRNTQQQSYPLQEDTHLSLNPKRISSGVSRNPNVFIKPDDLPFELVANAKSVPIKVGAGQGLKVISEPSTSTGIRKAKKLVADAHGANQSNVASRAAKPKEDPAVKHMLAERKARKKLRELLDDMVSSIPSLSNSKRPTKTMVMNAARAFIMQTQEANKRLELESNNLDVAVQELEVALTDVKKKIDVPTRYTEIVDSFNRLKICDPNFEMMTGFNSRDFQSGFYMDKYAVSCGTTLQLFG